MRPPPNFRTLLQPPKLAGQKVGIKRYSPFWRAIRSSMTPVQPLAHEQVLGPVHEPPFWHPPEQTGSSHRLPL